MVDEKIQTSKLLGADGKEIKKRSVPTVKYKDFLLPVEFVKDEEMTVIGDKGIRPSDIIRELRATQREMRQRFVLLATGMVAAATDGNGALKEYLDTIGLVLSDLQGKVIFKPDDKDKFVEETITPSES